VASGEFYFEGTPSIVRPGSALIFHAEQCSALRTCRQAKILFENPLISSHNPRPLSDSEF
jgi:hypothetical protein